MGATFTTVSFVLQALHTFKTKDVRGISLGMYCVFITGVGLWLAYGVMLGEWPIIIANGITVSLALAILVMSQPCKTPSTRMNASFLVIFGTPNPSGNVNC
jgi:MtN3 and saliva related transmembrane protein